MTGKSLGPIAFLRKAGNWARHLIPKARYLLEGRFRRLVGRVLLLCLGVYAGCCTLMLLALRP